MNDPAITRLCVLTAKMLSQRKKDNLVILRKAHRKLVEEGFRSDAVRAKEKYWIN